MLGCTVAQLLTRVDSYELAEWEAFERAFGPLGNEYDQETLACILDQLGILTYLTGMQYEDNPIPIPRRYPRPHDVFAPPKTTEDDTTESVYEFDRNFD